MPRMWSGLAPTAGGGIALEQLESSSNEFVLQRWQVGFPRPLSWSSKGLLGVARRRGLPTASPSFMRRAAATMPSLWPPPIPPVKSHSCQRIVPWARKPRTWEQRWQGPRGSLLYSMSRRLLGLCRQLRDGDECGAQSGSLPRKSHPGVRQMTTAAGSVRHPHPDHRPESVDRLDPVYGVQSGFRPKRARSLVWGSESAGTCRAASYMPVFDSAVFSTGNPLRNTVHVSGSRAIS
jgi:hypothetical protein